MSRYKRTKGSSFLQEVKLTLVRLAIGLVFAGIAWLVAKEQIHKMTTEMIHTIKSHTSKAEQDAAANP